MATERWVVVDEAGRLFLCVENDGARFLNRGPEREVHPTSLDELSQMSRTIVVDGKTVHRTLRQEAEEQLRQLGFPV